MPSQIFPHFAATYVGDVCFDRNGIGVTSRGFDEAALWVLMRPSTFLSIATPLPSPRSSLTWLRTQIELGEGIAPAELRVRTGTIPLAVSHEGRHRMTNLKELLGDRPVPVRISLQHLDDPDVDTVITSSLRRGMRSQRGRNYVMGPLFGDAEVDLGGLIAKGIPPPDDCIVPLMVHELRGAWYHAFIATGLPKFQEDQVNDQALLFASRYVPGFPRAASSDMQHPSEGSPRWRSPGFPDVAEAHQRDHLL